MSQQVMLGILGIALGVVIIGTILKIFKQPHVVVYIAAGTFLGMLGLIDDPSRISSFGEIGIILLLFFIGMHMSLPNIKANWKIITFGSVGLAMASVLVAWILGTFLFAWPFKVIILIGFIITHASTAVIMRILQDWNIQSTKLGQNIISIVIAQDLLVIPMMFILEIVAGGDSAALHIPLKLFGGALFIGLLLWVHKKGELHVPFGQYVRKYVLSDSELQLFLGLAMCLGFALVSIAFGLTTGFGAFIAGLLFSYLKEAQEIQRNLEPFRVFFMALFFIYIGLLIDVNYLLENIWQVLIVVFFVLAINTVANMFTMRILGFSWKDSYFGGAILGHIGEFGFVLLGAGEMMGIVNASQYQFLVVIIALSLVISPLWIRLAMKLTKINLKKLLTLPSKLPKRLGP